VETATGLSKYLIDDAEIVALNENEIVIGNPVNHIIADLNADTVTLYEGVTSPEDWTGDKYTFDGTDWTLNPDWVEPTPPEELTAE
jgi:hypothetical protein